LKQKNQTEPKLIKKIKSKKNRVKQEKNLAKPKSNP
jgi:hypothetical protein